MGLPVTIYRSTDAGAPVIHPTKPSDWITILKACLVDGYGSKIPLGWTLEYEDVGAFKAAFRNSQVDGSGGYFRIASIDGSDNNSVDVDLKCALEMSDIESFVKPLGSRRMNLSSSTLYVAGWTIIGTSRGLWIIQESPRADADLNSTYAGYQSQYFIGDLDSFTPNDAGCFTIVSGDTSDGDSINTSYSTIIGGSNNLRAWLYDTDGGINLNQHISNQFNSFTSSTYDGGDAEILGIPLVFQPVVMTNLGGYSQSESVKQPLTRAIVPGLNLPGFTGYRFDSFPLFKTINGVDYYVMRNYFTPFLWIQCSGEWYA